MQQPVASSYMHDAIAGLRELYGARFAGLAVRSPAPGPEPEDDVDMELLVILEGAVDLARELARISELGSALDLAYETFVPITPVSIDDFRDPDSCSPYLCLSIVDAERVA